jgi:hypothetical protein
LIYLGFITEGKLAAVLITPLGVANWPVIYIINTAPPLCKLHGFLDTATQIISVVMPRLNRMAPFVT